MSDKVYVWGTMICIGVCLGVAVTVKPKKADYDGLAKGVAHKEVEKYIDAKYKYSGLINSNGYKFYALNSEKAHYSIANSCRDSLIPQIEMHEDDVKLKTRIRTTPIFPREEVSDQVYGLKENHNIDLKEFHQCLEQRFSAIKIDRKNMDSLDKSNYIVFLKYMQNPNFEAFMQKKEKDQDWTGKDGLEVIRMVTQSMRNIKDHKTFRTNYHRHLESLGIDPNAKAKD